MPPQTLSPAHSTRRSFLLGLLIGLVLGVGGVFLCEYLPALPNVPVLSDRMVAYRSDKGFSFKHPASSQCHEESYGVSCGDGAGGMSMVQIITPAKKISDESDPYAKFISESEYSVAGKKVVKRIYSKTDLNETGTRALYEYEVFLLPSSASVSIVSLEENRQLTEDLIATLGFNQ